MSIVEDPDLTIQGRITEVKNIPIATDYTTSTTSLTVGKFTQTNTVFKTVTAAPKMVKKRGSTPTEEDRALAKRQAASCPALPQYLQKGENYFSDSEWVWIVENGACWFQGQACLSGSEADSRVRCSLCRGDPDCPPGPHHTYPDFHRWVSCARLSPGTLD